MRNVFIVSNCARIRSFLFHLLVPSNPSPIRYQSCHPSFLASTIRLTVAIALLALGVTLSSMAFAEEIRDYYAEPGLHPFKVSMNDTLNEHIDPFGGTLQIKHTDIVIPGDAGLDIRITRTYTSLQDLSAPGTPSPAGVGWTIHFGRIVIPQAHSTKLCTQSIWRTSTRDNPSLELPSGGRELLVVNDSALSLPSDDGNTLITKSHWKASPGPGCNGMIVTSPGGVRYTMDQRADVVIGGGFQTSWFTTKIEDVHGNSLNIEYETHSSEQYLRIKRIEGSTGSMPDGRVVNFSYKDIVGSTDTDVLEQIEANGQIWRFQYSVVPGPGTTPRFQLDEVIRPDNLRWKYFYKASTASIGRYNLERIVYPLGGEVTYTYGLQKFDPADTLDTTVVTSKVVTDDISTQTAGGTWLYTYEPQVFDDPSDTSGAPLKLDRTTVQTPTARNRYYHIGMHNTIDPSTSLPKAFPDWAVGLLVFQETLDVAGTHLYERISNNWGSRIVSTEDYLHGREALRTADVNVYAPVLTSTSHERFGPAPAGGSSAFTTTYSNHDIYGNPQRVIETTNIGGVPASLTRDMTYYHDTEHWILSQVATEITQGVKRCETCADEPALVERSYFGLAAPAGHVGQLAWEERFGVRTSHSYTPQGNVGDTTNARGNATTRSLYERGIPQREDHPEATVITRVVNATGTVASETNARGFTTHYEYDDVNRLRRIVHPINTPVDIVWSTDGRTRTLTRGAFQQKRTVDGFGRTIRVESIDTAPTTAKTIAVTTEYDALGRKRFTSYPFNPTVTGIPQRTEFQYDPLDRVTKIIHPDGKFQTTDYDQMFANRNVETNERGITRTMVYRAYGTPDGNRALNSIETDENSTLFVRNLLNQPLAIIQGATDSEGIFVDAQVRDYSYNSNHFLTGEAHPETGTITYGRDELGNKTSVQVAAEPVTSFSYDGLDRLTFIDYPIGTLDEAFEYDGNGNLTAAIKIGDNRWDYQYDANGNLIEEKLTRANRQFPFTYIIDALDNVAQLKYPDNLLLDYAPDSFGRPSMLSPYVVSISYHPNGAVARHDLLNGLTTTFSQTDRLFVEALNVYTSSGDPLTDRVLHRFHDYDATGNVNSILDPVSSHSVGPLTYDAVDRLKSATGEWGVYNYDYDARGNILSITSGTEVLSYSYVDEKLSSIIGSSSLRSYGHDGYGNVNDVDGIAFSYNDAPRLETVTGPGVDEIYRYDAHGMRLVETDGLTGNTKTTLYSRAGHLLFESMDASCTTTSYIRLGSTLIAKRVFVDDTGNDADGDLVDDCQEISNDGTDPLDASPSVAPIVALPGTTVTAADTLTLSTTAFDDEDGSLTDSLQWTSSLQAGAIGFGGNIVPTLGAGTHILNAAVTDSRGATTTSSITVTVENSAPVLMMGTPIPSSGRINLGGDITLSASVTDPDPADAGLAASITWSSNVDGALGSGSSVSPSNLSGGPHTITASVTDAAGATDSAAIDVYVNRSPSLTILTPAASSTFTQGETITFTATASDPDDGDVGASIVWAYDDGAIPFAAGPTASLVASLGVSEVQATVVDADGVSVTRNRSYTVIPAGASAPEVSATWTTTATVGVAYQYDADGVIDVTGSAPFTFSKVGPDPSGLSVDLGTGAVAWTPSESQIGNHSVTLHVDNAHGSDERTYTVAVGGHAHLSPGMPETRAFGYSYGSDDAEDVVVVTFAGTASDLVLHVTGFDVDTGTEVQVVLNGNDIALGFLTPGADGGLNGGDAFSISAAGQVSGTNVIAFRRTGALNPWGVTDLLLAPPGVEADFTLVPGTLETGGYGNGYGSDAHPLEVVAEFTGTSSDLRLTVDGYDIDYADEVSVYLNGALLGYLSEGSNNAINGGDGFILPAGLQLSGRNELRFVQKTSGWIWGITNVLLDTALPDIVLTAGAIESGEYGHGYGTDSNWVEVSATFVHTGTDVRLSVVGYDVDFDDEVSVLLNGRVLGFLTEGPNNGLNGGDVFTIPAAQQLPGNNWIQFKQGTSGWIWGVTRVLAETVGTPVQVATPSASHISGEYSDPITVSLSVSTSGAEIRYTTDGVTTPTASSALFDPVIPIVVDTDSTILARGFKSGLLPSDIATFSYTFATQVTTPTLSHGTGVYTGPIAVSMDVSTPGAEIRYTLDGTPPITSSVLYDGTPIVIGSDTTLRVKAFKTGWLDSEEATATYTVPTQVTTPTMSHGTGIYAAPIAVSMDVSTPGAQIRYTLDGTSPTASDILYDGTAVVIGSDTTLRAKGFRSGWMDSEEAVATYSFTSADFTLTPGMLETGGYGNGYGSDAHPLEVVASFTGTSSDLRLTVEGYDIDYADEVSVYLNGALLGYLSEGPNNALNGGDDFIIPAGLQLSGANELRFVEKTSGWIWGITNVLLDTALPDIVLTPGANESGEYGHNYGTDSNRVEVSASFPNTGTDLRLSVIGYDVDFDDEVEVLVNGRSVGFLSEGPDNGLNGGDVFTITAAQQIAGNNWIQFKQGTSGWIWGVTDVSVEVLP